MKYPSILLIIVIGIFAYDTIRVLHLIEKTDSKSITPFNRAATNPNMAILVLGDSTAVGVGAQKSEDSTAGRLAKDYPEAEVINLSKSGQRIDGLLEVIKEVKSENFSIILIQIGANDIIRLTSMKEIEEGINNILIEAKKRGEKVVFLHSGDIGEAKFFPWYLRSRLTKRSLEAREIYQAAAQKYGADYVDLISAQSASKFKEEPERYYSKDRLHLSGEGYGLWYEEIEKKLQ